MLADKVCSFYVIEGLVFMAKPKTEQNKEVTKDIKLLISREQWDWFEAWYKSKGCQSMPEGVRLAIHTITLSQENNNRSVTPSARAG